MKLAISRMMLFAVAALAFSSAGFAQEVKVRAKVPFSFVIGNRTYPAGEYAIQTERYNHFLLVRSEDGQAHGFVQSFPLVTSQPAGAATKAKFVFHRIDNTYFLAQIWAGRSFGRELPQSSRETEMAANRPKSETVIAASIVR